VQIGDERIGTRTIVWAAGVRASSITAELQAETDRAGRVRVREDLSVPDHPEPGHPEVFVVGDLGVLFEWAWAYLTWQRGSRVILDPRSRPCSRRFHQAS
jgi:NADH dehydrogenase FAD-containing subunit